MKTSIDNFNQVKSILNFDKENSMYMISLVYSNDIVFKNYYIYSIGDLNDIKHEIIELCAKNNFKAMINVNRICAKKVAKFSKRILNHFIKKKLYMEVSECYSDACHYCYDDDDEKYVVFISKNIKDSELQQETTEKSIKFSYRVLDSNKRTLAKVDSIDHHLIVCSKFDDGYVIQYPHLFIKKYAQIPLYQISGEVLGFFS